MRTVVITGGSAGIGRAVAEIYARRGWRIGLIARGEERLEAAAQALQNLAAPKVAIISADVAEASEVETAADRFEQELSPIEVWVNDAMTTVYAPFLELSAGEFERVTRVCYLGAVNGTRAALRRMRARRSGAIVNVGSGLAYHAIPLQSAYCGAKFAIRGFTEALRAELIHDRLPISLSMVHLPGVNTPQFDWARNRLERKPQPAPPVYQPEVAARAIVKAGDEGVRKLFVGKSTLQLFLGSIVAPGLLERMMAASAYEAQQSAGSGRRRATRQPVHAGAGPAGGPRPVRRSGPRARHRRELESAAPRNSGGRRAAHAADRHRAGRSAAQSAALTLTTL